MKITETRNGAILEIQVKPKAREFKITMEGEEIVVYCTEEPVKGKVNKELLKEFSKLFHHKAELVSGFSSKQKRLLIEGIGKGEVERILLSK